MMSQVNNSFAFIRDSDEPDEIRSELIQFFDGYDWQDFLESVENQKRVAKSSLISSIMRKIEAGMTTPEIIFKSYTPQILADAMGSSINRDFMRTALEMNYRGSKTAQCFIESLVKTFPDETIKTVVSMHLPRDIMEHMVKLLVEIYGSHPLKVIEDFLLEQNIPVVLAKIDEILGTTVNQNRDSLIELMILMSSNSMMFRYVHDEIVRALEYERAEFVDLVLQFIEKGNSSKRFSYSEAFGVIFEHCSGSFLQSVLVEAANRVDDGIIQVQCELLDSRTVTPLRELLRKRSGFRNPYSDEQLIQWSVDFQRTRVFPDVLAHKFMFERYIITNVVGPQLRVLSRTIASVQMLVKEMEKRKMLPKASSAVEWEPPMRQLRSNDQAMTSLADIIEQSKVSCERFAPELINSFHVALFGRHSDDVISFANTFETKVLKKMSFSTQEKFAEIVVSFLCSNLQDQHRLSLSILALRCQISKYITRFFECTKRRECSILINLHKAAIMSAEYIKLGGARSGKGHAGVLDVVPVLEQQARSGVAVLDKSLIQRLRWRTLREDTYDKVCWLPEFLSLCSSDTLQFLRWECKEEGPISYEETLSKLGITTNAQLFPQVLFELSRCDITVPEQVISVMLPLFETIPESSIKLPEHVNMEVLFMTNNLWCSAILCHPEIMTHLRNPVVAASQALLRALPFEDDIDQLFSVFPHAFAAMLINFESLVGDKPRCLCEANQMVEGRLDVFRDAPRFAVVSIVSVVAKRQKDLFHLAEQMRVPEWTSFCLFFAVCLKQFDVAANILREFPVLFSMLRKGMPEENMFVGAGKWTESLIEFAIYCASKDISFSEVDEWKRFLDCVRIASWPDRLTMDNENLCILSRYSSKYV